MSIATAADAALWHGPFGSGFGVRRDEAAEPVSAAVVETDPDRPLIEDARAGSTDAFEGLVRRYQSRILNFTLAATARSDEAEDLTQEVFLRAYRGLARFRGESSFKTWVYSIATNVVRTHLARRIKRAPVWAETPAAPGGEDSSTAFDVAAHGDLETDTALRQAIDGALAALPEDLRLAVILRDVQGLEYREIAEITGSPMGTVESRIFRARRRLRPMLESVHGTAGRGAGA